MLPLLEATVCKYLAASTKVEYPLEPGTRRVTLLQGNKLHRVLYRASILVEQWSTPFDSDVKATELHQELVDMETELVEAHITNVSADIPKPLPDPDSELDRYQIVASFNLRTLT